MTRYRSSADPLSALARLTGNLISRKGAGRLCIVNYHRILELPDPLLGAEPDLATFRWQMRLLADRFNVLPLADALAGLAQGTLPARAVCITFDDGYRSTHDLALPVLREFSLPATVFITTGFIGEGNMWNDRILEAVRALDQPQLDLDRFGLGAFPMTTVAQRQHTIEHLTEAAKYLPPPRRQELIEHLDERAGVFPQALMLSRDMVRALADQGIEVGAHTITHPILTKLSDEQARYEIGESKRQLEAITGAPVRYFAYPNGKVGMDFDQRHVEMARTLGFEAAFTTAMGPATRADNLFTLPRSRPWDNNPSLFTLRLLRWLAS